MTLITGYNLIGAEESAKGPAIFTAIAPESLEKLKTSFHEATKEEIHNAIEKAEAAFLTYKAVSNEKRALFLEAIAEEILNTGDSLIQRCMAETALPEARLTGERLRTVNQLKLFAGVVREGSWVEARIDTALPDRQPLPRPDLRQMQIPLGPVGIFGAGNFPLAFSVAGGDTASALAAGCPVVVKGHPLHPGTSELIGRAILKAADKTGMPDGVFSLLQGKTHETGKTLVMHPKIAAIGFTGSFSGGKALFDAANARDIPIPVFAEMGSVNPVFILPGALKERSKALAEGLAASVLLGVGQFCTNPGLVVTQRSEASAKFYDYLKSCFRRSTPGTMLSGGMKNSYKLGTDKLSQTKGVQLLAKSAAKEQVNTVQGKVFLTDYPSFSGNPSLAEEIFGPSTLGVETDSKEELLKLARGLEGHLTVTLQGTEEDLAAYADLVSILEKKAGRLLFNGFPTGVEVSPAMVHGGPFPATTHSQSTSVGTAAIKRFVRPVCYQNFPQSALPEALKNNNPLCIWRLINGEWTRGNL